MLTKGQHWIWGKLLTLNCRILNTGRRRKFKFGENTFQAYPNILVDNDKLDLNALLKPGNIAAV